MKRTTVPHATIALALAALLATASIAAAAPRTSLGSGAALDDSSLTPAREAALARQTTRKEAALGIDTGATGELGALSLNKYGLQTRPVTGFQQERTYWCGPAAARQSLSFHKALSGSGTALPSQATLATRIGTTTSGSTTVAIASALNAYSGTFGTVSYLASDITGTTSPYETFVNRIGTMLRSITINPTTPIILTQTAYIPRYGGTSSRHYMTVSGIDDRTSPMRMRSVDPHYSAAYYGTRWEGVGTTSTNGLCRACYQADLAGTNKAMAW